jgi:hypothetical protein
MSKNQQKLSGKIFHREAQESVTFLIAEAKDKQCH